MPTTINLSLFRQIFTYTYSKLKVFQLFLTHKTIGKGKSTRLMIVKLVNFKNDYKCIIKKALSFCSFL